MHAELIRVRSFVAMALVVVSANVLVAQAPAATPARTPVEFDKREEMIPMRDGVKLHTIVYTQKGITTPRPFILNRTPYGIAGSSRAMNGPLAEMLDDGYIFVFQDIRGRFTSEGQFEMLRPPRDKKVKGSIDEGSDTYDTIDWLLKNVPNNIPKVGMLGVSYPGWLTVMATLDPHPALKAASPQASPADMFIGDDFHHNGAFRLSYGFEYAAMMEAGKELKAFEFDKPDLYDWYLTLGSLSHIDERYLKGKFPTWTNFASHSSYDKFWQKQSVTPYLTSVKVPMLNVAGWWDQEDFYGPIKIYETLEPHDTKHLNYLVVGPWNHGGWNSATGGQKLGKVDFGSATSAYFRKNIEAPWFAYWLHGKGTLSLAEATTFESGSNSVAVARQVAAQGQHLEQAASIRRRMACCRSTLPVSAARRSTRTCRIPRIRFPTVRVQFFRRSPARRRGAAGSWTINASSTAAMTSSAGRRRHLAKTLPLPASSPRISSRRHRAPMPTGS